MAEDREKKDERPKVWETVPKGTEPSTCTGHKKAGGTCTAEIFWIERPSTAKNSKKKTVRVPVDCDVEGGEHPDSFTPGRGVNHYTTCPDAGKF